MFIPQGAGEEPVPLRVSVVSSVARSCPAFATRAEVEERLRTAGFTISDVHNAEMEVELDCVPVAAGTRYATMAVRQCLSLSELVPSPEHRGHSVMATTWRQCQSYTSSRQQYPAALRMRTGSLFKAFLSDFGGRAAPPPPPQPAPVATPDIQQPRMDRLTKERIIFYSLYTLVCLSVLLFWLSKRRFLLAAQQDHAA